MNLYELAKDIHANAVAHGWWEDERPDYEIRALIHSEWSEALEEARAGRPMVWQMCTGYKDNAPCQKDECRDWREGVCELNAISPKPEGIAVELIDGCIRVLDWLGWIIDMQGCPDEWKFPECHVTDRKKQQAISIPELIDTLHRLTICISKDADPDRFIKPILAVFVWLTAHDINPYEILRIKHEYNKGRPYKHGKEF